MRETDERYDVVVIRGGAAGLSGAVALLRSRRRVLVVDAGQPRNAPATGVHNYLGREDVAPADLLADGRAQVAGYGGEVASGVVTAARRDDDGFCVTIDGDREVGARRLLIATGLVDELPPVPGLAERWGRDVLHCPYCHGWEVRDQPIGVLATGANAVHQALLFRQLSDDVVVFRHTGPQIPAEQAEQLAALGVAMVDGEVLGMEVADDRLTGVRLASGEVVSRAAVVVAPRFAARAAVLEPLGVSAVDQEMGGHVVGSAVPADPTGATSVRGVWVAGNVSDMSAQVVVSAAAGLLAGAMIDPDLVTEDARRAVASLAGAR